MEYTVDSFKQGFLTSQGWLQHPSNPSIKLKRRQHPTQSIIWNHLDIPPASNRDSTACNFTSGLSIDFIFKSESYINNRGGHSLVIPSNLPKVTHLKFHPIPKFNSITALQITHPNSNSHRSPYPKKLKKNTPHFIYTKINRATVMGNLVRRK